MSDENYDPLSEFLAAERQALGADAEQFQQTDAHPTDMDVDTSMFVVPDAPSDSMELHHQPTMASPPIQAAQSPTDISTLQISSPMPTSEFQQEWQTKHQQLVIERDEQSKARHLEVVAEAKESMDKFYAEYNERRDRAIQENRNNQEIEIQSVSKGELWERVWKQIDLATRDNMTKTNASSPIGQVNNSPFAQRPQDTVQNPVNRDTGRMRELLQDLKRDDKAPGVKPRKTQTAA
ncbi:Clathrin light chain [Coemansia sp. RSA 1286]|nr:Clathrin light chain [Coemansia sp. RSA 1286]